MVVCYCWFLLVVYGSLFVGCCLLSVVCYRWWFVDCGLLYVADVLFVALGVLMFVIFLICYVSIAVCWLLCDACCCCLLLYFVIDARSLCVVCCLLFDVPCSLFFVI